MSYTAQITDNLIVEVFKNNEIYDRVGPWADIQNAQNFIDTRLRTYEENDVKRASGELAIEEFKEKARKKMESLGIPAETINEILSE